ncbi:MAG: rRNA (cytidine1402-2-O)-methyltransferase [Candidatus Woesearchaeota archaeon]|nr:rRNA (cytidine1402-2-O)-methyltransferase [Candidatus Woesearchaeota archaeon]
MLYIISTPIGNSKDITLRALETLKDSNLIICEDSRRIKNLLKIHNIDYKDKTFIINNEYNEKKQLKKIIELIKTNNIACLVTDAGTPLISDPGFLIIRDCIKQEIPFTSIPGPSAAINALILSGFPSHAFEFLGFLPKTKEKKKKILKGISKTRTTIFYESPYRIKKTLEILNDVLPTRLVCICREMTKKFEETIRGTPKEVLEKIHSNPKGEFVLLIAPEDYKI